MGSLGEEQAFLKVMEVATISCVPMALKAAIRLNVMDILATHDQFLSPTQIASHFDSPLAPSTSLESASISLDRILRVLASHGFLSSSLQTSPQGEPITTYGLNSISHFLVQSKGQGSLAPFVLLIQDPVFMQCFYDLHEAVLDGSTPFTNVHGIKCFSYTQKDRKLGTLFDLAMANHTKLLTQSLLETYNGFEGITSLVDVGGGIGACLGMITSRHPHIKGINFDLSHVVAGAPQYPGVEHVAGDMFQMIPEADAVFMKWILHDWSDTRCLRILENCHKALPRNGKVIVVDAILPNGLELGLNARLGYQMDLLMFSYCEDGKERTQRDLEKISKASGFSKLQVVCNLHGCSIVEIYKN